MSNELDSKIEQILKDLYQIDPAFKQHELRIKEIIKEVLLAKPDTKFDEAFAESLKHKLMAQADLLKEKNNLSLLKSVGRLKRLSLAFGLVAVAVVIVTTGFYYNKNKGQVAKNDDQLQLFAAAPTVTSLKDNAFGNLALATQPENSPQGLGGDTSALAAPQGTDNSNQPSTDRAAAPLIATGKGGGLGGGGGTSPAFMPPLYNNVKYVYKGGDFTVDQNQMEVYKRIKTPLSANAASSFISKLNFGLVDLHTFSDLGIQSMNFTEDKDYGYNFYVNFQEGTLSIGENWLKWPELSAQCIGSSCSEPRRLQMSDVPDSQTLISMADQFLKDHNIPTDTYGEPFVESSWRQAYDNTQDKTNFYIPDIMTMIYPLKINGNEIYDEGGNKTGMFVNINIRLKRVSGTGELYAQNYESSMYDTETDTAQLIKSAENGGYHGAFYYGQESNTMTAELGKPYTAYMKTWQYSGKTQSSELSVPVLIFPITNSQDLPGFYRKNVVVPLVKDLLNEDNPPVRILPAPAQ